MRIQEFDYSVNLLQALLWQYDEAINLLSLINKKQTWYDTYQTQFWSDWYTNVFNIETANQFGLSVWSYILNLPLYLDIPPEDPEKPNWGFNNNSSYPILENTYVNFFGGNFSTKGQILILTLEEQRFLLRLRYFQLCSNGVVGSINTSSVTTIGINEFLDYLIKTSNIGYDYPKSIWALDGLDMTMTYIFNGAGFPQELFTAIELLDLLPRPTGVKIKTHINYGFQFGFNAGTFNNYENTNRNFGWGNFIDPFILGDPELPTHQVMLSESGSIMLAEDHEVMVTE